MSELTLDALLPVQQATDEWQRRVIEANIRLAESGIVRRDYAHEPDGMRRFLERIKVMREGQ